MNLADTKEFWYDWMGGNETIFRLINDIRNPTYDMVMRKISWLGEHEHFVYYFAAFTVWMTVSILLKAYLKQYTIKFYVTSWLGVFFMLLVGYGAIGLLVPAFKTAFSYPRPYVALVPKPPETVLDKAEGAYFAQRRAFDPQRDAHLIKTIHTLETIEPDDNYRSMPSGHMAFTILLAVALWPLMNSTMKKMALLWVVLMGWSRISLGMHFPADVVLTIFAFTPLLLLIRWALYKSMHTLFGIKC